MFGAVVPLAIPDRILDALSCGIGNNVHVVKSTYDNISTVHVCDEAIDDRHCKSNDKCPHRKHFKHYVRGVEMRDRPDCPLLNSRHHCTLRVVTTIARRDATNAKLERKLLIQKHVDAICENKLAETT